MVPEGKLNVGDVVFLYASPPPNSLVGVIAKVKYPYIFVAPVKLEGSTITYKELEEIDLSEHIPISKLSTEQQKELFTERERKKLSKVIDSVYAHDIFGGNGL
jgi:hypothetical protein